ncbi:hypothetical protein M493_00355 [Geobacillus genomosp. 3]|uniref:Uncharacterized protein n=1 Tax=Geobacillus genomosp. 3 TaxID=1921421 RepID=S5Z0J8_GEOG3|nr:hypothetical protein M493_00355 [Geobacillus genomosp. 3]
MKSAGERVAAMGKCSSPAGICDPEGEGYLTPSGGEPELDNRKAQAPLLPTTVI